MKRTTLFAVMALTTLQLSAQNSWDGSSPAISTITTNGKVAIGTATPTTGYGLTVKNTNNTQLSGIYNEVNNTVSGSADQYGIFSKINCLGTTGYKIGFNQQFGSNSTTDNYAMLLTNYASNVGNRMGLVSTMFNGTKTEVGVYSVINPPGLGFPVQPSADRSGYFIGAFEVVARAAEEKVFIVNNRTNFSASGVGTDVFRIYGDGRVFATEINVKLASQFPDYVFASDYKLMPLTEVRHYITTNKHLPNMPTAETVANEGMNLGELNKVVVEKLEELTLYILQQQAEIDALKQELESIKH
jgi:hypothetical protein